MLKCDPARESKFGEKGYEPAMRSRRGEGLRQASRNMKMRGARDPLSYSALPDCEVCLTITPFRGFGIDGSSFMLNHSYRSYLEATT
jgi:hypothetical protein